MSGSIRWPQSSNWHFVRFLGGLSHDRVGITTSAASDTTVVLPRRSENSCTSRPLSGSAAADDTSATAGGQQSAAASRVIATSNTTRSLRGTRAAATTATGPIAAHPFSCNNCACKNEKPTRNTVSELTEIKTENLICTCITNKARHRAYSGYTSRSLL